MQVIQLPPRPQQRHAEDNGQHRGDQNEQCQDSEDQVLEKADAAQIAACLRGRGLRRSVGPGLLLLEFPVECVVCHALPSLLGRITPAQRLIRQNKFSYYNTNGYKNQLYFLK